MEEKKKLPQKLRKWASEIEATSQSYISLRPAIHPTEKVGQSQLGGFPYWSTGRAYPTNSHGEPLYLLAQINFAELPDLLPFPIQGLLQIFIADTPLYGMGEQQSQSQEDFRIIFHEEVVYETSDLLQDFSFLPEPAYFPMPWLDAFTLEPTLLASPAPPDHPKFIEQLGDDFFVQFGDEKWANIAVYRRYAQAHGHKLGGYPHFPQEDPREEGQTPFLLLQLDSDTQTRLNWGDRGTAHFFITEIDLLEKNFEKVLYTWSCY